MTTENLRAEARAVQSEAGDEYTTRVALLDGAADRIEQLTAALNQARDVLASMAAQIICPRDNALSREVRKIEKALEW